MLMRGTQKRSRAELKDAFERLNASVAVSGEGAHIEVRGENLVPTLELVAECCASRRSRPRSSRR